MMKWVLVVAAVAVLGACGVDGEPVPAASEAQTVQPTANPGVKITPRGVRLTTGLGVKIGGVRVGLGL